MERKSIPKPLRVQVWNKYIGEEKGIGNCYCCEIKIDSKFFEAGHVIAVAKGGKTIISNLRPICSCCNKSMSTQNLEEFKKLYELGSSIKTIINNTRNDTKISGGLKNIPSII